MEHNIGVGVIVGLTVATSIYVWNNNNFNKAQKTVLLILFVFPPAQWLGILLVLIYNSYKVNNSSEKVQERKVEQVKTNLDTSISNLTDLKNKGILTDEEYKTKVHKINAEKSEQSLKNSLEYKQLKSLFDSGILTKEELENKIKLISYVSEKDVDVNEINDTLNSANKNYTNSLNDTEKHNIFYKIDNIAYTVSSLRICHEKGTVNFWRNTVVELQDGSTKTLEKIRELSFLLK